MEEIKEKLGELFNCILITMVCSIVAVIASTIVLYITTQDYKSFVKLDDKFNVIMCNTRSIENTIRESQSTKTNIDELLNDYRKLKLENELLLDKIQLYREKYEKMP